MKVSRNFVAVFVSLVLVVVYISPGKAADTPYEVPKLISFQVSQKSIDVNAVNSKLSFSLVVSHPVGIRSSKTSLWFKSKDSRISVSTSLQRDVTKLPNNQVRFTGELALDPSFPPGLYDFYAEPIEGEAGSRGVTVPQTSNLYPPAFNDFLDGETSVVVRSMGKLNLTTKTFVGPSHTSAVYLTDDKPTSYRNETPIFRVGETYDPTKFFIVRVPNIKLKIETSTPLICTSEGDIMTFVAVGTCSYRVFTEANNDYLSSTITLSTEISSARTKPTISIPVVASQDTKNLPKRIETYLVYNTAGSIVQPVTTTPTVCFANFQYITIVGGGKCSLNYQSSASSTHLASDLYTLSFDVVKETQTLSIKTQSTVDLSAKTLDLIATASSGGIVGFTTESKDICEVNGSKLNLLRTGSCKVVASQLGDSTIAPVTNTFTIEITGLTTPKIKSLKCVKGKKVRTISGVTPKCPKGFKRR